MLTTPHHSSHIGLSQRRLPTGPLTTAVPFLAYLLMVLAIWGPFALCSGMPYENTFLYNSESLPVSQALFYRADPLRIHTNTFYHLSYELGELIGLNGSFIPFQIIYAFLWWARGALVFVVLRRFLPGHTLLCFLAGSFTIVHASDGALQWVGQLNQFGFIFWMLLGFYCFICAVDHGSVGTSLIFLTGACFFEYMSLWSYEAQLFLIFVAPVTLLLRDRRLQGRLMAFTAAWYAVPIVYLILTIQKYFATKGVSYQVSVMRSDWTAKSLLGDLGFNMYASLGFWNWTKNVASISDETVAAFTCLAMVCFLAGAIATIRVTRGRESESIAFPVRTGVTSLVTGIVLLFLSFPVYLLLAGARGLWRTQLLSGIAAALVFTASISLLVSFVKSAKLRALLVLVLGATIVVHGSVAAVQLGSLHAVNWEKHRAVLQGILEAVPSLESPAMILLLDLPRRYDGFGHNMWFDFALRLAYPGVQVAGMYFYDDHTAPPGANLKLEGDKWVWDKTEYPPMILEVPASRTVIIRYAPGERMAVLPGAPGWLLGSHEHITALTSTPSKGNAPSARAANRYLFRPACCQLVQKGVSN